MNQFEYQKTRRFAAQVSGGLEDLAAEELKQLGARDISSGFRVLHFNADVEALYRINYKARFISRVLAPLASFRCRDRDDLYKSARAVDWRAFFDVNQTFAVFSNVTGNDKLTHSKFAALCLKDAVADFFRSRAGQRPDVNPAAPDVWIYLHIEKQRGTISLDTSGGSLHRRGYRRKSIEAPIRETLAAAMVTLSGWDGQKPLYDPMCGSGTLLCEAMMAYCRIPAGFLRQKFGFQLMPDFNGTLWHRLKKETDAGVRPLPEKLLAGSDIGAGAVDAATANCRLLPGGDRIEIRQKDFNDIPALEKSVILCNPPYGIRLDVNEDISAFYKRFGDFLKQRCKGSDAYIFFGNRQMLKQIGLRSTWKKPVRNAALDGRIAKFSLY